MNNFPVKEIYLTLFDSNLSSNNIVEDEDWVQGNKITAEDCNYTLRIINGKSFGRTLHTFLILENPEITA